MVKVKTKTFKIYTFQKRKSSKQNWIKPWKRTMQGWKMKSTHILKYNAENKA